MSWKYYAAIFETQLLENEHLVIAVPPVKIEVLSGPASIVPLSHGRAVLPLRGELGEELSIPSLASIYLDEAKRYVIVTTRTQEPRAVARERCHDAVQRVIAFLSIIYRPFVFSSPVWSGWVRTEETQYTDAQVMFSPPQRWDRKHAESQISAARRALAEKPELQKRFGLMARLFNRAIGLAPGDEMFLWLWTCLEVFPMVDTTDIAPISAYLAPYVGKDARDVKAKLQIGRLFGIRSRLVHDGSTGIEEQKIYELITRLQLIVYTVLRATCNMPYDGRLDEWLNAPTA